MEMDWMSSLDVDDEYEKLIIRLNPLRVSIDNSTCANATLVKVDSANKHGILLEVVQVLTDLDLTICKAYISSDGGWFMDIFHVTDKDGNKITNQGVIEYIQQSLGTNACLLPSFRKTVGVKAGPEHTTIELIGTDRPGLLSEVFAVLTDLECNVIGAEVWSDNMRVTSVVYVTEQSTEAPIDDPDRISTIKVQLCNVLKGHNDKRGAKTVVSMGVTQTKRRLHQMMFADRDYERVHSVLLESRDDTIRALVTV
ncbi:hypothetical protein KI387_000935 [Taxus chinensis]|uniref:ACT domain-containing protein n=1 Tax=Taxus chinensis TaxID=29808 RepID=A0AA38GTA7_TAXCH|nr:hypothetical protein KI387_000935 [Taxus chinensis]